jgi:RES domain-containing protein
LASKIRKSLLKSTSTYEFENWFRVVTLQYSDKLLSAAGSRISITGGRFNFGQIDSTKYPVFSCLYIASDYDTAMAEKFSSSTLNKDRIKREEFGGAIVSHSTIRLSGQLESVLDVTDSKKLKPFVNVIKKIAIPQQLVTSAKRLRLEVPDNIRSTTQLQNAIRDYNWAANPAMLNIPSASQIFGQIVHDTGIQGILYRSKYTEKECLAIFPSNFENEDGQVCLDDKAPDGVDSILDKTTWKQLE